MKNLFFVTVFAAFFAAAIASAGPLPKTIPPRPDVPQKSSSALIQTETFRCGVLKTYLYRRTNYSLYAAYFEGEDNPFTVTRISDGKPAKYEMWLDGNLDGRMDSPEGHDYYLVHPEAFRWLFPQLCDAVVKK